MKPSAVTTAEYDLDPIFAPPEAMVDRILHDIAGPEGSLRNLALACSTTAPALAAWLARPDIAARLEALLTAAATRVRLVAANALPRAISVALAIIDQFQADESHVLSRSSSIRDAEYRRRGAETARRAASLIARLANYATKRSSNSPSPREGAGGRAAKPTAPPAASATTEPPHTTVSDSPSPREGAGGRANGLWRGIESPHTTVSPVPAPPSAQPPSSGALGSREAALTVLCNTDRCTTQWRRRTTPSPVDSS